MTKKCEHCMSEAVALGEDEPVEPATERLLGQWPVAIVGFRRTCFPNLRLRLCGYVGRPVAILAINLWYRGVIKTVTERAVVLDTPSFVMHTGTSRGTKPKEEVHFKGPVLIPFAAVEIIAWPKWCYAPMPLFDREEISNFPVGDTDLLSCQHTAEAAKLWDHFNPYRVVPKKGMRLAVLCNRYLYRGVAGDIHEDFMVLEKGIAVEQSGDPKDVLIPSTTIAKIFQCRWCHDSLRPKKFTEDEEEERDV